MWSELMIVATIVHECGHVHDAALVRLDVLAKYASGRLQCSDRRTIVDLHEARVSRDVSRKNRRELSAAFGVDHINAYPHIPTHHDAIDAQRLSQ